MPAQQGSWLHFDTSFFCVGVSHKTASMAERAGLALSVEAQTKILVQAQKAGISDCLVLSTCNRTEIYGFAQSREQLKTLLLSKANSVVPNSIFYNYTNDLAVQHILHVATGLDSQVVGDVQICSQIRESFTRSKLVGLSSAFLERLVSMASHASKRIKSETKLSQGTRSVASAALRTLTDLYGNLDYRYNVIVYGCGQIGTAMCQQVSRHMPQANLYIVNRSQWRAQNTAQKYGATIIKQNHLLSALQTADILIVATAASETVLHTTMLAGVQALSIVDLSMPSNVSVDIKGVDGIKLVSLDKLCAKHPLDPKALKHDVRMAEQICQTISADFLIWCKGRQYAPALQTLNAHLGTDVRGLNARFAHYLKQHIVSAERSMELAVKPKMLERMLDGYV